VKKYILLMFLLFMGCAHHNSYNYADFSRSFSNDMTFYSQYEILYKVITEKGNEKLVIAPFLADMNNYLPKKVVKLHFGLSVINPHGETFTVWIDSKNDEFETKRIVHMSESLPNEFISIDLPSTSQTDAQIKCYIMVLGKGGNLLYQSPMARYKIRGVKK